MGSLGVVGQESALATIVQQLSVLLGVDNVGVCQCQLLQARYTAVRLKSYPNSTLVKAGLHMSICGWPSQASPRSNKLNKQVPQAAERFKHSKHSHLCAEQYIVCTLHPQHEAVVLVADLVSVAAKPAPAPDLVLLQPGQSIDKDTLTSYTGSGVPVFQPPAAVKPER